MQKLYYSISEVSSLVDEEQHILRYWEKEFESLKPKKNRGGNRIYSEGDLDLVRAIKILIREEKLSLRGAKEQLKKIVKNTSVFSYLEKHGNGLQEEENTAENGKNGKTSSVKIQKEVLKDLYNTLKDVVDYLKSL
jgi:DNA-binding transcriptional MerR regulator